jgi:hypothetical protein
MTATPAGNEPEESAYIVSMARMWRQEPLMKFPPANLLDRALSPYLLQHKTNPVHWREWGAAALAEAKAADKPILLSVGYAACHWCHVMAHESFEDVETAEMMNTLFINIKVDREERPDIDQIYMNALHATGQHGGWPLTMFLTPNGEPFWGGTYFPKHRQHGRPSFRDVLAAIAHAYRTEPATIRQNADAIGGALRNSLADRGNAGTEINREDLNSFWHAIGHALDPEFGGTGRSQKFPNAPLWDTLWRGSLRTRQSDLGTSCQRWLEAMCKGGIYDHVGGGLARYTVDREWKIPHFEKMLYDNAQFLRMLVQAHSRTKNPLFKAAMEQTIAFLQREMQSGEGGLISSYDADSEGEEGKFYVWNYAELEGLLGSDFPAFATTFDVHPQGNWEGVTILNRLGEPDSAGLRDFSSCLAILQKERAKRIPPGKDQKIVTEWNGLAVRALAECAFLLDRADWMNLASGIFWSIADRVLADGRLPQAFCEGKASGPCLLSGYAAMINAALTLHALTGATAFLDKARRWIDIADQWHGDGQGTHFYAASDAEGNLLRTYHDQDEATPASSSQMLEALARLSTLGSHPGDIDRARHYRDRLWDRIRNQPGGSASFLAAADTFFLMQKVEIPSADQSFTEVARNHMDPARDYVLKADMAEPRAIFCDVEGCRLPWPDPKEFGIRLREIESGLG